MQAGPACGAAAEAVAAIDWLIVLAYLIATFAIALAVRRRALHWRYPLERAVLDECAALLPGRHDFTAFTPTDGYHRRFERDVTRAEWVEEPGGVLAFWIEADSFMRHMVRTLVGTMLGLAAGRTETIAPFELLLEGRHRREAGDTAHAHGLYLERISYPEAG